jgi:hypothetical protein
MTAPPGTPVFNCIVNLGRTADGAVLASVANLPNLCITARTEREALSQIVAAFKQSVSTQHTLGEPIPWIDPPTSPSAGEVQRLIAVHL